MLLQSSIKLFYAAKKVFRKGKLCEYLSKCVFRVVANSLIFYDNFEITRNPVSAPAALDLLRGLPAVARFAENGSVV